MGRLPRGPSRSAGSPPRVVCEETANETNLVHDEEAESHAYQPGGDTDGLAHLRQVFFRVGEWHAHCACDEYHPCNRADTEEQEVGDSPFRIANRGEDQQRDSCGSRQTVDEPNDKRAQNVVKAEAAEVPAQPAGRHLCGPVGMSFRTVEVRMGDIEAAARLRI